MTDEEFTRAARQYGDTIFRVAVHGLRSPADAEDVTQTVLLKLYQYPKDFQGDEHLKHWLLRVTVNECRRVLSSAWWRRTEPLESWDGAAPGPDAQDRDVLRAVMALEPKYRLPIYLRYYENLSVKETAQVLGVKESTVQTRLQRARDRLRRSLTEPETKEGCGYVRPQNVPKSL